MAQRSARETRALCSANSVLNVGAGEEAAVEGPEALDSALRDEIAGLGAEAAGAAGSLFGLDIVKLSIYEFVRLWCDNVYSRDLILGSRFSLLCVLLKVARHCRYEQVVRLDGYERVIKV